MKPDDKRRFNKGGRPKTKIDLDRVRSLLASGMPQLKVAEEVGHAWPTILKRLKEDPATVKPPSAEPMDKEEFKRFKRATKLKHKQIAGIFGLHPIASERWAMGTRPIRSDVALAIRLLAKYPSELRSLLKRSA